MYHSRLKTEKKTGKALKRFNSALLYIVTLLYVATLLYSFLLDNLLIKGSMSALFFFINHFFVAKFSQFQVFQYFSISIIFVVIIGMCNTKTLP